MNKKFLITVLFAFVFVNSIKAQTYQKTDLGIKSIINSIEVGIQFYGPSIVRVLKSPEGKAFTKESLSVIKVPQKTAFNIKQAGDELSIKSESIQVTLNLKNGKISFSTPTGESLLSEKEAGVAFTDFNDAGVKTYSVSQSLCLG
jgi:alpha-D-xyloside xylohydrolase